MMTRSEIRTLGIERIARGDYERWRRIMEVGGGRDCAYQSWDQTTDAERNIWRMKAGHNLDDLGDLYPTVAEVRSRGTTWHLAVGELPIGERNKPISELRFATEWQSDWAMTDAEMDRVDHA